MKKSKVKFNENVHYSPTEMKRYLGALCETHEESLKAINENFVIVNRKLDSHEKVLNSHTEMIGVLLEDVSVLKEDVSVLKEDIVTVKEDLSTIKGDLKKKVDYDDFLSLVRRVQKIESKI